MVSRDLAFFKYAVDALKDNAHCIGSHGFHGLAHGGERRSAENRRRYIIEPYHRAVLRHPQAGFGQAADGAECSHVVESQQSGELPAATVVYKRLGATPPLSPRGHSRA